MVEKKENMSLWQKINGNHDWSETSKKLIRDTLIYILPIIGAELILNLGEIGNLTVGAVIALLIKSIVQWLKYKNSE